MRISKTTLIGGVAGAALLVTSASAAWYFGAFAADPYPKAIALMAKGDYRTAWVQLRVAIRAQPNKPEPRLALARTLSKLADPVAAEREFRLAAAAGANKWEVLPELGEAMIAQGKFKELLAQIPATAPDPAVAVRNLALRATAQVSLGDVPAAKRTLQAVKRLAPDGIEASLLEARLAAADGDLEGTERNVDSVLKRDPNQVEALLMREQLLTSKKQYGEALKVANRAVAAAPWSAMARIDRAYQLMFNNQDGEAQTDVNAVLSNQPQFIDAIYLNGILMARQGNYQAASAELARLENAGSRFPQALLYLSKVSRALGQKEAAAEQARRYNVLMPLDADGVKMLALTRLDIGRPATALPIVEAAIAKGLADGEMFGLAGRLYVATGNSADALDAFQKAVQAAPEDAPNLANLGMAQMRQGNLEAAAATLKRALALDPKLTEAQENLTLAYIQQNAFDAAQGALSSLAQTEGETAVVGVLRSELQLRQGDAASARATLSATLQKFPDSLAAKKALAALSDSEGASGPAVKLYLEVLAKQPADVQALLPLLKILVQSGHAVASIPVLEAAVKAAPEAPALVAMLADAYTATGTPNRAIDLITKGNKEGATPVVELAPLARAQIATGSFDQAKRTYDNSLKQRPGDVALRLEQVTFLNGRHDTAAAEASLRDAVQASPGDMIAMSNLVTYVYMTRGYDPALQVIGELTAAPANLPSATALKGDLLMRFNRYAEAASAFQDSLQRAPSQPLVVRYASAAAMAGHDDQAAQALRAWLKANPDDRQVAAMLARLEISGKRWASAAAVVKPLLDKSPNDPLALTLMSRIYLGTNDARALDVARQAYLAAPTPQTEDTLGWVMTTMGDVKTAIPLLQRAAKDAPADPGTRYHLAVALKKDGQSKAAVDALREATKSPISFDERNDAVALLRQAEATP